ncbi:hypothetical protein DASH_28 [Paenibacillus phage Dash]|nr:hypothetical protein DASH_28 [Paenibacillus phage Dash]
MTKALCNHLTQKPLFLQPVETLLKYNMDGKAPLQKEPLSKHLKTLFFVSLNPLISGHTTSFCFP